MTTAPAPTPGYLYVRPYKYSISQHMVANELGARYQPPLCAQINTPEGGWAELAPRPNGAVCAECRKRAQGGR